MPAFQSYIICTSPRSGSTLLCKLLQEAGMAGWPDSHFHRPSLEAWRGYYGVHDAAPKDALRAIFAAALAKGRGASDVFGLRLQQHSAGFFMAQLRALYPSLPGDVARIKAAFGRTLFVHLTRKNKLDQAISHVRAEQSGLWHRAGDGSELERIAPPTDPIYDRAAIAAQVTEAEAMDRAWEVWFEAEGIAPLRIKYDALSAAPYGTRALVLRALGVESDDRQERAPPVAKLADEINSDWAARYLAGQ